MGAERALESRTGSAGILYNLAEHPKSIRAVAGKLLSEALDTEQLPGSTPCPEGCKSARPPQVIYRVAPKVFLPDNRQQALCLTLEKQTAVKPFRFPRQEFDSVEDLNAWIMEFSQGRGELGKQLYAQCGGNCSPRYQFLITQAEGGLRVATRVACGRARDAASDDYIVSTAVRRRCVVAQSSP